MRFKKFKGVLYREWWTRKKKISCCQLGDCDWT